MNSKIKPILGHGAAIPFFIAVPARDLEANELAVVERLLREQPIHFQEQIAGLKVVGRCGCGMCPTIFFQSHAAGSKETDLVSMQGSDDTGGLVAAVLLHDDGMLTQLEFYSIDGHDPWVAPKPETLSPLP